MTPSWLKSQEEELWVLDRRLEYLVRVRAQTIYLWGSAGITANSTFTPELLLHIRNDPHGEEITLGTQKAAGAQTPVGSLRAGEVVSLPIKEISGIYASCNGGLESTVCCTIGTQG